MIRSTVALIAHDSQRAEMLSFIKLYRYKLGNFNIVATRETGLMISSFTGLPVSLLDSEMNGGDQQIGDKITKGEVHAVIFLRDPLISHSSEPDVNYLLRICDVFNIPIATNKATAEPILNSLTEDIEIWKKEEVGSR